MDYTKEIDMQKFLNLVKLYASSRLNTQNNGGTDSLTGFVAWLHQNQRDITL